MTAGEVFRLAEVRKAVIEQMYRDQVAATVRDAHRPMTAKEIGSSLSWWELCACTGDHSVPPILVSHFQRHYAEGLDVRGRVGRLTGSVRRHLEVLAREGLVIRHKEGRSVFWTWTGGERVDMTGLEGFTASVEAEG